MILSLILATVIIFPGIDATRLAGVLGIILVASLVMMGVISLVQHRRRGPDPELLALARMEKATWQMPPLGDNQNSVPGDCVRIFSVFAPGHSAKCGEDWFRCTV